MCDYSLEHVRSRSARIGDKLVSTMFGNSFTRGFAEVGEPQVAVCLAPGTELAFDHNVECDHPLGFLPSKKLGERMARFRRLNPDRPHEHHDALEFPSGRTVLLTRLRPGQVATVLQLPVEPSAAEPVAHTTSVEPSNAAPAQKERVPFP